MATPSVKEMKDSMTAMGVSFVDCTEKSELVARYRDAVQNFSRSNAGAPPRAPPRAPPTRAPPTKASASASPSRASRAPQVPKQMSVEQMGRCPDGKDGGEAGSEIRRVCSCKDFYEILRVERSCKDEDLKKAYRKSAIRLHPDKCNLTGAEEAFKKVSTAFSCLNDARQRSSYDVHGEDVVKGGGGSGFSGGFHGDIDAEELFRAFCGAGKRGSFKMENLVAAVQKNPWVLLVALTMLSNVVYLLEALIVRPFLLMVPILACMFCPPHVWQQLKTVVMRTMMHG